MPRRPDLRDFLAPNLRTSFTSRQWDCFARVWSHATAIADMEGIALADFEQMAAVVIGADSVDQGLYEAREARVEAVRHGFRAGKELRLKHPKPAVPAPAVTPRRRRRKHKRAKT